MHFTIPTFERFTPGGFECTPLGVGLLARTFHGKHPRKVERKLSDELRLEFGKVRASELPPVQMARGIKLERVHLELAIGKGGERRKVSGNYPVVIEPRWASDEERIRVAYHPSRQDEVVLLRDDLGLEEQLKHHFGKAWAELDGDALGGLLCRGKERLGVLSFSCDVRPALADLPKKLGAEDDRDPTEIRPKKQRGFRVLNKLGVNLTRRSAEGDLPLGMTRAPYREQLQVLLGAGRGQPILLVGPPGSGKTTLLHQLVADLLEADGYASHRNLDRARVVFQLSGRRLIAGMSHLGEWEKQAGEVLEEARGQRVILAVDDITHFGKIGRSQQSDRSLADFFRGPLARRELLILGECTAEQLRVLEEDAPSFAALFVPLHVRPTTSAETMRLLVREARELEHVHHVEVDPYALRTLLELGDSLVSGQVLPGKVMELLRELCRSTAGTRSTRYVIDSSRVYHLLSRKTGVPEILIRGDERLDVVALDASLSRAVAGQPEAIRVAVDLVARIKAGLTDPRRPYGVYLFTGPTGTGKTELAKHIAEHLYGSAARLVRFDMSELSGPDAPARLIGHRYHPEGLLTQRVAEQPFSLVLLDEIEKAHPSVLSLLLQLFEDGRLTDAAGKTAHFNHTVVIMTSNLGARPRPAVGFGEASADEGVLADVARAVREFFPPELFNRIDRIVPFRPLSREVAEKVAAKELDKLCRRRGLIERSIFVQVGAGVTERIAEVAFVAEDGARSIKRFLDDQVGALLTEAIAGGAPAAMQILRLYAQKEGFALAREALDEASPAAARWALEPLLDRPLGRLRELLGPLVGFLASIEEGDALAHLSARIIEHLGRHNQGEAEHAETVYTLDAMRAKIRAFRDRIDQIERREDLDDGVHEALETRRFGWIPLTDSEAFGATRRIRLFHPSQQPSVGPRPARAELLECLAEGYFLRRALSRVDEPGQHAIFVELYRVGQLDEAGRAAVASDGLLEALARAYAAAHGEVETWAGRNATWATGKSETGHGTGFLDGFLDAGGVERLVLRIVGLSVLDFFALEHGSHVWTSLARGPEVVRVRVSPAGRDESPAAVIDAEEEKQRRFDEAARRGDPAPDNPAALLPVVRKIRFDPPRRPGTTAPLSIEDYAMSYAETMEVRTIAEALAPIWLLRMSREDEPAAR
ncbi:MAG: AAA family ATPase [Byssovorax sp.]